MLLTIVFGAVALLSIALLLWQFSAALRFPLHQPVTEDSFGPEITILKPLKGATEHTADCLRSWMKQEYAGKTQILFGVADEHDPACEIVRGLLREYPATDAVLIITSERLGPNGKVSTLVQLGRHAKHDLICVSDADVRVSEDFLTHTVAPMRDTEVGLVNCFYQLANPTTFAMKWEAIAVNSDFWSQVLQSNTIKPQDFALGAVMITRREMLARIGGFESLLDYLADDYELGRRIAATGARIELSPVVVECWDKPMTFREVWNHQLRWARTIRACQPVPYFFSVLSNVTFWVLLWSLLSLSTQAKIKHALPFAADTFPLVWSLASCIPAWILRISCSHRLQSRLTRRRVALRGCWLVLVKDVLQFGLWLAAFTGNTVEWRGNRFRIGRGGRLIPR